MSAPSYAAVAAKDAPPEALQPHPDPALLTTEPPSQDNIADDAAKLNIVSPDFKQHPATLTSIQDIPAESTPPVSHPHYHKEKAADRARRYAHQVEDEGFYLWNVTKHYLFRPAVAGGLLGVGARLLGTGAAAALALFGCEGFVAEQYGKTPAGQAEERKAREEGALLYKHAREHLLRPGVLGGLVGLVNLAVVGGVGFLAYKHWEAPHWDRRSVSAISVGVLTLWSGEAYLTEKYRETHH
ncbi:hypothetical protein EIP86_004891 [Pleurotus ostreatoroseus]|nr:hypothetical protein EIP86_004891 [Pleurotus ostreatoroseus]